MTNFQDAKVEKLIYVMSSVILNATVEKYFDILFVKASSLCRAVAFFANIKFCHSSS